MSVCILVDEKRGVAYAGMREVLPKTVTVDWSDLKNPDMNVMLMDIDRASLTKETLRIMGYDVEIMHMSQDAKPNWLLIAGVAMLVGYVAATIFF